MQSFYRWHETHPGVSKAEALRQAQLSLLHGKVPPPDWRRAEATGVGPAARRGAASPFTPDPKAPYAHPFYWAPFVLFGNWR